MTVEEAVERLGLEAHPEGGFYRRTYRSPLMATPDGWPAPRAFASSILYLLAPAERSAWHRVRGEELWLWQGGGSMRLDVDDHGHVVEHLVGPGVHDGEELQALVPAQAWQSATPVGDAWSLVACVVVPGFEWSDFELRAEH